MYFSLGLAFTAGTLFIPIAAQNSAATAGTDCNVVSNHTVVEGDNLANLATSANVTLDQIEFVNPQISNPRLIQVGDVVQIPNSKCVAPAAPALAEPTATCSNSTDATTTVKAGDTLIIIAKENLGITLPALLAANPQITNPNNISVGESVNVPLCSNVGGNNGTANAGSSGNNGTANAGSSENNGTANAGSSENNGTANAGSSENNGTANAGSSENNGTANAGSSENNGTANAGSSENNGTANAGSSENNGTANAVGNNGTANATTLRVRRSNMRIYGRSLRRMNYPY